MLALNYTLQLNISLAIMLFKIDDEAAQLQMKSAEASYSQAEAGVTAATSGSSL